MVLKMMEFKTFSGTEYAWDGDTGLFVPFSPIMKAVLNNILCNEHSSKEETVEMLRENFSDDEIIFCYDWLKKWERIKHKTGVFEYVLDCSPSRIRRYVLRTGILQLTLGITEDCNFRCNYCVFSDNYEYSRNHSKKYMNFPIAKKAIDYYFSLLEEGKKYNPLRSPSVGFYGGEPLLNFELIKKCVEYIEGEYKNWKTRYTLTTNGSLLDKEKIDWLVVHDFTIAISLDGPENEHNRLRVYSNGGGTYRDVMKNVNIIMNMGYKNVFSLPVFDWRSDLFAMEEFFSRYDVPPVMITNLINDVNGCRYYEQFTKEDYLAHLRQLEIATSYYFAESNRNLCDERPSFFDKLVGQVPGSILFDATSIYSHNTIMPFTGACVPGRKIFVDANGMFHACERINSAFPLGDIYEGLNFEKNQQFNN